MARMTPWRAVAGVITGVATMFVMRWLAERLEARDTGNALIPLGFLAAVSMDCVIDGVVIGTGFAIGARKRVLVSAALALEMFILGLATEIAMRSGGARPTTVVATCVGLAAVLVASALIGFTLLVGAPAVLATLLAFGSAALLYFVTEELLVRAHDLGGTRLVTSLFFLGFVAVFSAELFS